MRRLTPAEIRDAGWEQIRSSWLNDAMMEVHAAYETHGPVTTQGLADLSGINVLTVRPRTTDLMKVGLVECVGRVKGQGGLYQAVPFEKAEAAHEHRRNIEAGNSFTQRELFEI